MCADGSALFDDVTIVAANATSLTFAQLQRPR
jgi:hypothetical protein